VKADPAEVGLGDRGVGEGWLEDGDASVVAPESGSASGAGEEGSAEEDTAGEGSVGEGVPPTGPTGSGALCGADAAGPCASTPMVSATDTTQAPSRTRNVARRPGSSHCLTIPTPLVTYRFGEERPVDGSGAATTRKTTDSGRVVAERSHPR
jgi:hypothetical protein